MHCYMPKYEDIKIGEGSLQIIKRDNIIQRKIDL